MHRASVIGENRTRLPVWLIIVLVVVALGALLWLMDDILGLDAAEWLGKALAIAFMLACFGGLAYGIYSVVSGNADEIAVSKHDAKQGPDRSDCFPYSPGGC